MGVVVACACIGIFSLLVWVLLRKAIPVLCYPIEEERQNDA